MEPLLRNIAKNNTITAIKSSTINFKWPKIIGYADDVTIITENTNNSVKQIFHEYERLTRASGLKLNADKTIRNDISTNAQTLKHNINNVCNLIKLKQAI